MKYEKKLRLVTRETLEANLALETSGARRKDGGAVDQKLPEDGLAIVSASGLAIVSASGLAIVSASGLAIV